MQRVQIGDDRQSSDDLWDETEALDLVVSKTMEQKLGARGLRAIMEQVMVEPMYELPSQGVTEFVVDATFVEQQLAKDGSPTQEVHSSKA